MAKKDFFTFLFYSNYYFCLYVVFYIKDDDFTLKLNTDNRTMNFSSINCIFKISVKQNLGDSPHINYM